MMLKTTVHQWLNKHESGEIRLCIAIYLTTALLYLALNTPFHIMALTFGLALYMLNIYWLWRFDKMPKLFKEHIYLYPLAIGADFIFEAFQNKHDAFSWSMLLINIAATTFFARAWIDYFKNR